MGVRPGREAQPQEVSDAHARSRRLAAALVDRGDVQSDAWRQAVERVQRHVLVPCFYERQGGSFQLVDGARPEQREHWLDAVYDARESLVTEYDPDTHYPTSSATMPSIVLSLLESLGVQPGQRILDVGTGSGYLTALACERLGSDRVTSIDVGAQVVELARRRLREAGHTPCVVCGDGFAGHLPDAPYDRVVSTVSVGRVPGAWIEQTRPGGLIVATLPEMTVRLQRHEDGSASGRFIAGYAFMWMRGHAPDRRRDEELVALVHSGGDTRDAPTHLRTMLSGREIPAFWGLARLIHMPFDTVVSAGPGQTGIIEASDRSWVLIDVDRGHITQGGPRRLWDAFEALYKRLDRAGRPARESFGLTVHPDGRHEIWLDVPEPDHVWAVLEPGQ
jgi:protein-L-isoaspartate O-methyltransferase